MALAPGEHLHGHGRAAEAHGGLGRRAAQAGAAHRDVADGGRGEHRRDQVRAAAVVLLVGVGGVVAVLVAGDRLVLHAVVGGEVAAAQRQQRRRQAHQRHGGLAAGRARARGARAGGADRVSAERRRAHRAERPHVLHREPRLGQRALDQRDHGHRLGELHDAANAGQALRRPAAQVRLAARGDLQPAVVRAHRGRPVRRPVHEQAVAERHAAEAKFVLGNRGSHIPRLDGGRRTLIPRKRSCGRSGGPAAARLSRSRRTCGASVMPAVAEAGWRAVAPDFAGYRRLASRTRPAPGSATSSRSSASARELGIETCVLVVHDWGGLIGLRWACEHPDAVRGARDQLDRLLPGRQVARHGEGDARARHRRAADGRDRPRRLPAVLRQSSTGMTDEAIDEYWKALRRRRAPQAASSSCTAPATSPSSSGYDLAALGVPTLLLCGARTTSSRPWPAPTASSASCRTRSWWSWTARATSCGRTRRPSARRRSRASSLGFAPSAARIA